MQVHEVFVGVDVAKATLVCSIHGARGQRELSNDDESIDAWLATLPTRAAIAVESTGKYHQLVARLAHSSGRCVYVLNARDVFFYAKGLGARAKTDRKDAQLIAGYLAQHHAELKPWAPPMPLQGRVQVLLQCRAGVATKRSSLRQVLKDVTGLDAAVNDLEERFDVLLDEIDSQITIELDRDKDLSAKRELLRSITGVGPQASAMFTSLLSRVSFANVNALIAFTGLDPRPNDSGTKTGKRRITKRGNPELRRQLYLCAFAASHSKALGPLYRSIKAKGFKPTEALIILARKLLRVAWAVWKSGRPFDPNLLSSVETCAKT